MLFGSVGKDQADLGRMAHMASERGTTQVPNELLHTFQNKRLTIVDDGGQCTSPTQN